MSPESVQKATFPINDETIKGAVVKTLLESMDTLTKEKLLQQAIEHVISFRPEGYSYGQKNPTPLENIFNQVVTQFAREEVARVLKEDARIRDGVAKMVSDAWAKAMGDGALRVEMVDRIAKAIANGFVQVHKDY